MLPTLAIGPWQISTFVLVHAVAFAVAGGLAYRRLLAAGVRPPWIAEGLGATLLAAMGGAVVFFGVVVALSGGSGTVLGAGSSIFGALLTGAVAGYAYLCWRRLPVGRTFDAGIVALPLGQAIGRLACLLAGCCYGKPTDSFLAVTLPGVDGEWQPRYPTQLMSSLGNFLIFLLLISFERWRRRGGRGLEWPFAGIVTLLYGALYCIKRIAVEFVRDDPPVISPPFTWAHVVGAAYLVAAGVLAAWSLVGARRAERAGRA